MKTEKLEDISVRRLAREIGTAPAKFYNHYDSLNELLLEIAAGYFEVFSVQSRRIIRPSENWAGALNRVVLYFIDFAYNHQQIYRLMFGYIRGGYAYPRFRKMAGEAFEDLMELIYGYKAFTIADNFGWDDMMILGIEAKVGIWFICHDIRSVEPVHNAFCQWPICPTRRSA